MNDKFNKNPGECQHHNLVLIGKNSLGRWFDCKDCGTTKLVLAKDLQPKPDKISKASNQVAVNLRG